MAFGSLCACLAFLAPSCGGGGGGASAPPPVSITGLTAAASPVLVNHETTITAVFSGGTGTLDHGIGPVTSGTPVATGPLAADTTFTLAVSGAGGKQTQSVTVKVVSSIDSFTSSATTVTQGETTTLTAVFTGNGSIDHGVGPVTSGTPVKITVPASDVTYTLTVTGTLGTQTQALPLKVVAPPTIQDFRASAAAVSLGRSANLTAVFADGIGSVDHGVGAVTSGSSWATGAVTTATTWTLTVTNAAGTAVTRSLTLDAVAWPAITGFAPAVQNVTLTGAEAGTTLLAHFTGGVGAINRGLGAVQDGVAVKTGPVRSKLNVFKLTVTNLAGDSVTATTAVYGPTLAMASRDSVATIKADGSLWCLEKMNVSWSATGGSTPRIPPVRVPGLGKVVSMAPGRYDTATVLAADGTVWNWATTGIEKTGYAPHQVQGLPRIMAVEAGMSFTAALAEDGSVWTWGSNSHGELGDGTTVTRDVPALVAGLPTIVNLAAGNNCVLAVDSTGAVWGWGDNAFRQLGNAIKGSVLSPARILDLAGVVEVCAWQGSLALKADGTLVDVTRLNLLPDQSAVAGCTDAVAITAGDLHYLVLKEDGTVHAFGFNTLGQSGAVKGNSQTPVAVPGLTDAVAISAYDTRSLVLKADGSLWGFGDNECGFLDDLPSFQVSPTLQVGTAWSGVAAGGYMTVTRKADGSLWNTGFPVANSVEVFAGDRAGTPSPILGLTPALSMAAGANGGVCIGLDGRPSAWGPLLTSDGAARILTGYPSSLAVAAGFNFNLFLDTDHKVWAVGYNSDGQLGTGTTKDSLDTPLKLSLDNVAAIAAGFTSSAAVKADGTVWVWGRGTDFAGTIQPSPVQVAGLTGVQSVAVNSGYALALKTDGTVWGWGNSQMLDSTATISSPIQVAGLTGVVALAAGVRHALALHDDGSVSSWGGNNYGQLGDGSLVAFSKPARVPGLSGVTAIAAGDFHSVALTGSGTYVWGYDHVGQLGLGRVVQSRIPMRLQTGKLW